MFKQKLNQFKHYLIAVATYWYYGRPARKLIVVGVTGTKGKSTTCRLIASVLEAGGYKVGMLTTVEFQIAEKRWANDKKMTMLGLGQIQKILRQMVKAGCRYAVVETSSEGILQYRHYGLNYDVAVFTNLGTEHSERHGGFENLRADKGKMFATLSGVHKIIAGQKVPKVIIANADDENANFFLTYKSDQKYIFGLKDRASFSGTTIIPTSTISNAHGSTFTFADKDFEIKLIGEFNLYNALAALAVGKSQGIDDEKIISGLKSVKLVSGRMEFVEAGQNFKVVVDYAHEPMSFTQLFDTLRGLIAPGNKVIAVIGSDGGGRDTGKRVQMGKIAGELCDFVVVTDVNCFDENPAEIAEMLASGARLAGKKNEKNLFVEIDREKAFSKAFELANSGDVVALTAKGTEPVICVANGKKIVWDDRNVANKLLKKYEHR